MSVEILIVDDDFIHLELMKRILKDENYKITTADSGFKALDIIKKTPSLNLILMDALMPNLSGFETCVKSLKINKDIPIILVTGLTDEKSLKHAFDSGAIDFITKPVKKIEITSRIKSVLKNKEAEIEIKNLYADLLKDLKTASSVQAYLLSDWIEISHTLALASTYIPMSGVSGDLFDLIKLSDDKHLIYIGDISGHGVQASLMMAAIQMAIRLEANDHRENIDIVHVLNRLNTIFTQQFPNTSYMTFLIGIMDTNTKVFKYFSAGHPPLISYNMKNGNGVPNKEKGSFPIGMFESAVYSEEDTDTITMDNDTALLFYTDGLFECNSKDQEKFDLENLIHEISNKKFEISFSFPDELLQHLYKKGFRFDDDVTILFLFSNYIDDTLESSVIEPKLELIRKKTIDIYDKLIKMEFSEKLAMNVELLLTEHLNNIAVHGKKNEYKKAKLEKVYLSIKRIEDKIQIVTLDKGLDWVGTIDRKNNENQSEFNTSGRGLNIIESIAESINHERINSLNKCTITISI